MMAGRDWVWITGNHDPLPPAGLSGSVVEMLREGNLVFRHEPGTEDAQGELAGHLHPAARVVLKGRSIRRSCFVADPSRMILPSFGAYTGGLSVLHEAFAPLFDQRDFTVFMRGKGQIYQLPGAALSV